MERGQGVHEFFHFVTVEEIPTRINKLCYVKVPSAKADSGATCSVGGCVLWRFEIILRNKSIPRGHVECIIQLKGSLDTNRLRTNGLVDWLLGLANTSELLRASYRLSFVHPWFIPKSEAYAGLSPEYIYLSALNLDEQPPCETQTEFIFRTKINK